VVEAVRRQLPDPSARAELLNNFHLTASKFVLATIHRPENTDIPAVLARILSELGSLQLPVVLPLHPRTAAAVRVAGIEDLLKPLRVIDPVDGATFLGLAAEAALLVSDSGGVQEEVTVLGRPLVVVRRSTERPEAFEHHATLVTPEGIAAAATTYLTDIAGLHVRLASLASPYGDGSASDVVIRMVAVMFR
jgi:UDP-N-acetylglucosamine 2-epimerase (non-hydrolysing)